MISKHSRHDVIVVGAGMAGLTAARSLIQSEIDVLVLEARNRIGGRVLTRTINDSVIDMGATWFWPNEPLIQSFLEAFNLSSFPQPNTGDVIYERSNGEIARFPANQFLPPSLRFIEGGQALAKSIASTLPNDAVMLNTPVTAIDSTDSSVIVHTAGHQFDADAVVIALPPSLAVTSISFAPPLPQHLQSTAAQTAVWMGGMVKVVAIYERPLWRENGLAGVVLSEIGPFRELHDHSSADNELAAIFGFAPSAMVQHLGDAGVKQTFADQLVRLFGIEAAPPKAIFSKNWSSDPFTSPTTHGLSQSTSTFGHPVFKTGSPDRIFWASTETANDFAGHIEGAIMAGLDTAESVKIFRGSHK